MKPVADDHRFHNARVVAVAQPLAHADLHGRSVGVSEASAAVTLARVDAWELLTANK